MTDSTTLPFSEGAYNRGVVVGSEPKAPSTAPTVSLTDVIAQTRVEGSDLDNFRPGILQSARDGQSGELVTRERMINGERIPAGQLHPNDFVTFKLDSGQET
jgi:hypothetical protein